MRNERFGLYVLSLLFAGIALALSSPGSGLGTVHRVTALYQSQLLDDEVSISALKATTFSDEFRSLVDAQVDIEPVKESPFHIQVTTERPEREGLLTSHKRAIHLLSVEIKEQALTDVQADLRYLEEVRKKTKKLGQARLDDEARISLQKSEPPKEALSASDSKRVVFLKEEVKKLEGFLNGGSLPKTVRVQLDRDSLNAAEKRVRAQQAELSRLAKLFHPSSKAVQAQSVSLEQARNDLAEIERELSEIYLRALRVELETLDDKASSRIREGLSLSELKPGTAAGAPTSSGSSWMDEKQKELEQRADLISSVASLKLEGEMTISQREDTRSFWLVPCWAASLAFFLLAIFTSREKDAVGALDTEPARKRSPLPRDPGHASPAFRLEPLSNAKTDFVPDQTERFFNQVWAEVTERLQRPPRRLLILSDGQTNERLSFSIRLANSLGRHAEMVRLIDFDFHNRSLSERLGRQELPGVSELIHHGGPVDEFFSSISGTRIQFAPAGNLSREVEDVETDRISKILGTRPRELTIVDASIASPLFLLTNQLDVALWITENRGSAAASNLLHQGTLSKLRADGLPIFGVSLKTLDIFPLL